MTIEILTNECTLNSVVKKEFWIIKGIERKMDNKQRTILLFKVHALCNIQLYAI